MKIKLLHNVLYRGSIRKAGAVIEVETEIGERLIAEKHASDAGETIVNPSGVGGTKTGPN